MKKSFLLSAALLFNFISLSVNGQQRTLIIQGDTCEAASLKASISGGTVRIFSWYKDSVLLQVRGAWQRSGTIVAGGNGAGSAPNQLYDPHGVFVDKDNNVYVVDNLRVQKWALGAKSGVTVAGGTTKGSGLNEFYAPVDVVVDHNKNVYVSDYLTNSVRKWAPGATSGVVVAGGNGAGARLDQLSGPQSICMDKLGNLYIADRWNDRVMKWAPGATSGVVVAGGNGRGAGANQLREPYGVGVDNAGNVYVSDPYNFRVQKWKVNALSGVTAAGGNGQGANANQLNFPSDISVDSVGNVYILDAGKVLKWAPNATYGMIMAGGFGSPANANELDKIGTAWGLYVDNNRSVYVSDLTYGRVVRFRATLTADGELPNAKAGTYKVLATLLNEPVATSPLFKVNAIPPLPVIKGPAQIEVNTTTGFTVTNPVAGATYTWAVPADATILAGQGKAAVTVRWGETSGKLSVAGSNSCGISKLQSKNISAIKGYAVIYGDTCAGATLHGGVSLGVVKQYDWFKDSVLIQSRGQWNTFGVIAAGGNGAGSGTNQLNQPHGIYIDSYNAMYIVDGTNYRVQKWNKGATAGVTIAGGNGKGIALNQFASPIDVVVDDKANVYVSDNLTHSIRKWAPKATSGVVVAGGKGAGSAADQLNGPQAICLDRLGNLYIADRWNNRVQKWAPGAITGVTVAGGYGKGPAANQLSEPIGVGVDYAGNIYVSDSYNYRVQKWAPGATSGVTVAGGNGKGLNANQLNNALEIDVDSAGNVYVLDGTRVQRWAVGAKFGVTVAGGYAMSTDGTALNKINTSFGLFVDRYSAVFVSDLFDARVRRFLAIKTSADADLPSATPGNYKLQATTTENKTYLSDGFRVTGIPPQPVSISSAGTVYANSVVKFRVTDPFPGATYNWTVPADAVIQSGWGTSLITVKWGASAGQVTVFGSNACGFSKVRSKTIFIYPEVTQKVATISLYPNPAISTASVVFSSNLVSQYEISVTNMMGKQLMLQKGQAKAGQNKVDLSVGHLDKDIYLVNVKYDNKVSVLKLSKQ